MKYPEAPETVRGRGQANARGARRLEYSLGITGWGQNSKHSKNTIMTLLLLWHTLTDTLQIHSDVDIKCSSITDNQSLKLSKAYSSVRWFPQTPWPPLSPTPRLFVVCVSHCFDANAIMNCLAEKGISLPPYNKGSVGGSGTLGNTYRII